MLKIVYIQLQVAVYIYNILLKTFEIKKKILKHAALPDIK